MIKNIFAVIILTSTLVAQTFNVSTTAELRVALTDATSNGEADTIVLADGTYKTTDDEKGTFIFFDNEDYNLTLIGSSSENVILSGDNKEQIFNHQSTQNAPLKLEKLSFLNGNNTGNGGGVYTDYKIDVIDCNFSGNYAYIGGGFYSSSATVTNSTFTNNSANNGGGFYSSSATVTNSIFTDNSAMDDSDSDSDSDSYSDSSMDDEEDGDDSSMDDEEDGDDSYGYGYGGYGGSYSYSYCYGGGFYSSSATVTNSTFTNNSAKYNGGGFHSSSATVTNSTFTNNSAKYNGGGFRSSSATVTNSTFTNNSARKGGGFYSSSVTVSNILLKSNISGIYIYNGEKNTISNSIFIDNNNSDIDGGTSMIVTLKNNYLDTTKLTVTNFKSNNIFENVTLGFIDEANEDFKLTADSDLIDAGTNEYFDDFIIEGSWRNNYQKTNLLSTDADNKLRVSGGSIDIGPYEFSSTRPTINKTKITGTTQEQSTITFDTDYTLSNGREVSLVEYDYLNNGVYTTDNSYTYKTAGTYTVNVMITDSNGEFSISKTTVTIAPLAYENMTFEQKLIKAIDPIYYDDIVALIKTEKDSTLETAIIDTKQYVQDNLSEFNLVTQSDMNSSIIIAVNNAKENVISNPSEFGIDVVTPLIKENITNLSNGWNMVAIPTTITDMSLFDDAQIVWLLADGNWSAYSSDTDTTSSLKEAGISIITTLSANSAVWVER